MNKGTIVVTGASSGIGNAVAHQLARSGWKVVVTARREDVLREQFDDPKSYIVLPWDLSELDSIKEYTKHVKEKAGAIKGLVHCAGMGIGNAVHMIKSASMKELFEINTFSAMLLVSNFSKRGMIDENASFVLISSIAAHVGTQGQSIYSATKGALEGFIKGSAAELAEKNIRINAIAPGLVKTELVEKHYKKLEGSTVENMNAGYPLGVGMTSDVANCVEYLINDNSRWLTGQAIVLDGGYMVRKS